MIFVLLLNWYILFPNNTIIYPTKLMNDSTCVSHNIISTAKKKKLQGIEENYEPDKII